ncbi:hypothetical protein ACU63M_19665 [Klebsiella aerogenes]|uniref:hypothetical protein n=1 Tax=Klebsiella aerogenes TaxID=548 RepID=UPI002FFA765C
MILNIFYCKSWFSVKKKPIDLWGEKKAREIFESGEPCTVLIGSDTNPSHVINFTKKAGWVSVGFLDGELREYLLYSFKLLDNGQLFLSMAVHREFAPKIGEGAGFMNVSNGTTYLFNEDGNTIIREEQFNPHILEESTTKVNVSGNYETFPVFGDYQSIIRKER